MTYTGGVERYTPFSSMYSFMDDVKLAVLVS